jgi:hypothetical protein
VDYYPVLQNPIQVAQKLAPSQKVKKQAKDAAKDVGYLNDSWHYISYKCR